jgi:Zn finger protein HypA/HybF involved in hydrogenase expression
VRVHELSIALEVCRMAESTLGTASCADLLTVGVQVGSEAGIEYDNFEFCLTMLLNQPPFGRARVQLERSPGDALNLTYLEVDDGDPHD